MDTSKSPKNLKGVTSFLNQEDVSKLIATFKTSSRRPPNDSIFASTNALLALDNLPGFRRLGIYSIIEHQPESTDLTNVPATICSVLGCQQTFDTVLAYDQHYNRSHRYQCSQCHRMLPSGHLLDLHLSEQHDSFFAAQLSAHPDKPWFACFLNECPTRSLTPADRKDHCIREHSFPAQFRFENKHQYAAMAQCEDKINTKQAENSGPVRFVNFGHSRQKTFMISKTNGEDIDYAKVLTKSERKQSKKAPSVLESNECCMGDLMDCLNGT